jgi:hypothetical protein
MMGQGFADRIGQAIVLGIILLIGISFILGGLAVWGLPRLWIFLKPLIHAITT